MPTVKDIIWVAGLLEGEGYFAYQTSAKIDVSMIDKDVIIKLRNILNPTVSVIARSKSSGDRQQQYRIQVCGLVAIQWMMTIYSLMGERRKARIREILKTWKGKNAYSFSLRSNGPQRSGSQRREPHSLQL